jgi:hypothetical protein
MATQERKMTTTKTIIEVSENKKVLYLATERRKNGEYTYLVQVMVKDDLKKHIDILQEVYDSMKEV